VIIGSLSQNRSEAVKERIRRWAKSPLLFVVECLKATPSTQQAKALRDFTKGKFHSIRSGHGTGKDAFASWIILWFMATRTFPKIVCTGPTQHQLKDVLWAEINKWLRQSPLIHDIVWQSQKIYMEGYKEEWFATAVTCNAKASTEEQAETLAGFHADHILVIVDEASGVPDPVYLPLEGAVTTPDSFVLLIGNMTRNSGYFYDSHYRDLSDRWNKIHWSSKDSENVDPSWIEFMGAKYGTDSNVYRIRVEGEPPFEEESALIPLAWATQCIGNTDVSSDPNDPLHLGLDVARFGADSSVLMPRQGNYIYDYKTKNGLNTVEIAWFAQQEYEEMDAQAIAVDEIGIGAGVVDNLKLHMAPQTVFPVNVSNKSSNPKKYNRLRDELWWNVRKKCEKGLYRFPPGKVGQDLCDELATPKYSYPDGGMVKVESKKEMKARGVPSPDIAEALLMTEYFQVRAKLILAGKQNGRVSRPSVVPPCSVHLGMNPRQRENNYSVPGFSNKHIPKSRRFG
jgi:hypothetical protein